jgi:hypothetical protein
MPRPAEQELVVWRDQHVDVLEVIGNGECTDQL